MYGSSWERWALRNQREQLAVDEPINWVMQLGTHNAFNSWSDGHQPRAHSSPIALVTEIVDAPNQFYSMSTQLDLDSRMLAIDAHWVGETLVSDGSANARLCHSYVAEDYPALEPGICLTPSLDLDGDVFPSMRYFANGIKEIRNWLDRNPDAILLLNIENEVHGENGGFISGPLETYLNGPGRRWILPTAGTSADQPLPSRAELLAQGKRVVLVVKNKDGDIPGFTEAQVVARNDKTYETWLRRNQDFDNCIDNMTGVTSHAGPANARRGQFTAVVEDRTLQRGFAELAHELAGAGPGAFGELSVEDMRKVARCNYTIIAADFLGSRIPAGRNSDVPDFSRHAALVWSWKTGDRGQNGDCALLEAASGRWISADCGLPRHYVCAPPRSESGITDRSQWDPNERRFEITNAVGPWEGGPAACAAEFPGKVFSVPVNGQQHDWLKKANVAGFDAWMNYTDQAREGRWLIAKQAHINTPPVAIAGEDREIECGNTVTLDASSSLDADGDPLSFTWTGPFGTVTGPTVSERLPSGTSVITLSVDDGHGGVSTDSLSVTVIDTTAPSLELSATPAVLWPPRRQMVAVHANVRAFDSCDAEDVVVELVSIVRSGDPWVGKHQAEPPHIMGADFGTGDLDFQLRAQRGKNCEAIEYRVTYRATDKAGNAAEAHTSVLVPRFKP